MPPKQAKANPAKRGPPTGSKATASASTKRSRPSAQKLPDPFASSEDEARNQQDEDDVVDVVASDEDEDGAPTPRKRRKGGSNKRTPAAVDLASDNDGDDMDMDMNADTLRARSRSKSKASASRRGGGAEEEEVDDAPEKTIPPALLARLLHETFDQADTRITGDAARAAAKYVDVFVREAIARCVYEREGGFLEVEDLEKISAQLLMDF